MQTNKGGKKNKKQERYPNTPSLWLPVSERSTSTYRIKNIFTHNTKGANTSRVYSLHVPDLCCNFVVVCVLQHQHINPDAAQVPAQALQHVVTHHPQLLRRHGSSVPLAVPRHTLGLITNASAGSLTSLETSQTPTLGIKHNTICRALCNYLGFTSLNTLESTRYQVDAGILEREKICTYCSCLVIWLKLSADITNIYENGLKILSERLAS